MKSQSNSKPPDAITLLSDDHKKVQKLFKEFEKLAGEDDGDNKDHLVKQICSELSVHAQIEEEIFYPAVRDALDESDDILDEAEVEHATAKDLIAQLESMQPDDELYDAKVTVLGEYINHHIKEEQGELFPRAKKADLDLQVLGDELMQRKEELLGEMDESSESGGSALHGKSKAPTARKSHPASH